MADKLEEIRKRHAEVARRSMMYGYFSDADIEDAHEDRAYLLARIAELEAQLAAARAAMPEPDEVVLTTAHWKLIAHEIKKVRAQERERCAKVAAGLVLTGTTSIGPLFDAGWSGASTRIAAAIRALPDEVK